MLVSCLANLTREELHVKVKVFCSFPAFFPSALLERSNQASEASPPPGPQIGISDLIYVVLEQIRIKY